MIRIGLDLGLNVTQAIEGLLIINGKVCVWGDVQVGMVWASGKMSNMREFYDGDTKDETFRAVCVCSRMVNSKDQIEIERSFSLKEAKAAGLWGKNPIWKRYPKRMLSMRARSWALRDGFSDVLRGLVAVEEAVDYEGHPEYKKSQKMVEMTMKDTVIKDSIEEKGGRNEDN